MCNPPFYADAAELYSHARSKAVEPFSVSHLSDGAEGSHVQDQPVRCVLWEEKLLLSLVLSMRVFIYEVEYDGTHPCWGNFLVSPRWCKN
jgi:23S rRNA A1618 N6-methylase RlmF